MQTTENNRAQPASTLTPAAPPAKVASPVGAHPLESGQPATSNFQATSNGMQAPHNYRQTTCKPPATCYATPQAQAPINHISTTSSATFVQHVTTVKQPSIDKQHSQAPARPHNPNQQQRQCVCTHKQTTAALTLESNACNSGRKGGRTCLTTEAQATNNPNQQLSSKHLQFRHKQPPSHTTHRPNH